ncbi:MAG: polysaccharide pyruvyl transferase family protein, partial [Aquiluna sp.]|nr:polysaccharide pyruvyl transferase family protein [Aquiluna sp.]
ADYISVRGPLTAELLKQSGGPTVTSFGDPGVLLSDVYQLSRGATNGRVAFVRHFSHSSIPMQLPENFDEISVMRSRPQDIESFVKALLEYDQVVTSAMHVMITCQSYGIPCALVSFEGAEENVHGTGIKYEDYALGAGVEVMNPTVVPVDLKSFDFQPLVKTIQVSDAKKAEVREATREALSRFGL